MPRINFARRFLPFIGALALLLGGCVSPNRIHTPEVTQASSVGVTGIVALRQQELRTTINAQHSDAIAGQFGLIGSLIGSAIDASVNAKRAKAAEASVGHLRDGLLNYAPTDRFTAALTQHAGQANGTPRSTFVVRQVGSPDDPRKWIEAAGTDKVLLIDFDYALTPNCDGVQLSALVTLHARKGGRPPKGMAGNLPPVIYQNVISTVRYFPALLGGDMAAKAEELSADHAKTVRAALDLAQQDMAALILYDLDVAERPENAVYKSDAPKRVIPVNRFNYMPMEGMVEREDGDRAWVRLAVGDLHAE